MIPASVALFQIEAQDARIRLAQSQRNLKRVYRRGFIAGWVSAVVGFCALTALLSWGMR